MKSVEIASDICLKSFLFESEILEFKILKKDIKELNLDILSSKFDISAMDFSLYPLVFEEYALFFTGAKFQQNLEANLVKKKGKKLRKDFKLALSDKNSIFTMLLKITYPLAKIIVKNEDEIENAVLENEVHAGLVFKDTLKDGLCIENSILNIWSNLNKQSLPLPTKCFGIRRSLPLVDAIESQRVLHSVLKDDKFYENEAQKNAVEFLFDLGYKHGFYSQKINFYKALVPCEYLDFRFS